MRSPVLSGAAGSSGPSSKTAVSAPATLQQDPALGIGLVGMLVGDSPERGRQDQRDHGGRHQESGEWADVLHREGTCAF